MLINIEQKFWSYVTSNTRPPVDGSSYYTDFINIKYPEAKYKENICLPGEAIELIEQYNVSSEQIKLNTILMNEVVNKLKILLKDNESGIVGNHKVSWINVKTDKFDSKRLQQEEPDIYLKYLTKSSYRRLCVR